MLSVTLELPWVDTLSTPTVDTLNADMTIPMNDHTKGFHGRIFGLTDSMLISQFPLVNTLCAYIA